MSESAYKIGIGRRKTAVARVKAAPGNGSIIINGKSLSEYFPSELHQKFILKPLQVSELENKLDISAGIRGGGKVGQIGALIHGISRALLRTDEQLKDVLRREGFLTRDSRAKERRKYGLRGARKAKQYTKR